MRPRKGASLLNFLVFKQALNYKQEGCNHLLTPLCLTIHIPVFKQGLFIDHPRGPKILLLT
ncbi:MAG: hypothetical protein CRN43_01255 [Candidatus Nephrothrix sp. EaCA]|nr:MAG: hypothetical protein CRN43_01255 [Candidatus Nephrothrix sp. EaCA]